MGVKIIEQELKATLEVPQEIELPTGSLILQVASSKVFALVDFEAEDEDTYTIYVFKTGKVPEIVLELEYLSSEGENHYFVDAPIDDFDLDDDDEDEE